MMLPTLASPKVGEAAVIDNLLAETNLHQRRLTLRIRSGRRVSLLHKAWFSIPTFFGRSSPLGELYV